MATMGRECDGEMTFVMLANLTKDYEAHRHQLIHESVALISYIKVGRGCGVG